MTDNEAAWIPSVTVPTGPDIPTTFDAMWKDEDWKAVFESWAGDQPGWTGPLAEAVMAMAEWGGSVPTKVDMAQWILGRLRLASPPVDAAEVARAELEVQGLDDAAPSDVFDDLYTSAFDILSTDQITYGAFYNDVATYKSRKPVTERLVGPLPEDQWHRPAVSTGYAYKQMRNVWIQTPSGPQIVAASEGEEDVWYAPTEAILARIATQNAENIKDLDDGGTEDVLQLGDLVLIGAGHNNEDSTLAGTYGVWGTVTVKKGSTFDPGSLTFTAMYDQEAVRRQVQRFSQKKCRFA